MGSINMSIGTVIAIVGIIINLVVLVAGAVWVVGKIQTATEKLGLSIGHLEESIEGLNKWLTEVDHKVDKHSERLATLEANKK
jgi:uncharacterized protein YoxC